MMRIYRYLTLVECLQHFLHFLICKIALAADRSFSELENAENSRRKFFFWDEVSEETFIFFECTLSAMFFEAEQSSFAFISLIVAFGPSFPSSFQSGRGMS